MGIAEFSSSLREYCPCLEDDAPFFCEVDAEEPNLFSQPAECRCQTVPATVDTPVCGSAFTTGGLDVYRQYCASQVPGVQDAITADYPTYSAALLSSITSLTAAVDGLTDATPRTDLIIAAVVAWQDVTLAFWDDEGINGGFVPCLEGCAEFMADACCGDDDFVQRSECDLFGGDEDADLLLAQGELMYSLISAGQEPSACDPAKVFPGTAPLEAGQVIDYQQVGGATMFDNPVAGDNCFTVRLYIQPDSCPPDSIVAVAYLASSFDPANPDTGYLGDSGRVTEAITDFSFVLADGESFELIIMQASSDAFLCDYRFSIWQEDDICLSERM